MVATHPAAKTTPTGEVLLGQSPLSASPAKHKAVGQTAAAGARGFHGYVGKVLRGSNGGSNAVHTNSPATRAKKTQESKDAARFSSCGAEAKPSLPMPGRKSKDASVPSGCLALSRGQTSIYQRWSVLGSCRWKSHAGAVWASWLKRLADSGVEVFVALNVLECC